MKRIARWPLLLIAIPWAVILLLVQTVSSRNGMARGGDPAIGGMRLRPATGPLVPMTAATSGAVAKAVATPHYTEPLVPLAAANKVLDKPVTLYLELASDGSVFQCEIKNAKDLPGEFQASLREKILAWKFSFVTSPSFCTVELKLKAPATQTAPATTQAAPTSDEIAGLVRNLSADSYAAREKAQARLIEIGQPALKALEEARRATDPEVASRAEITADAIQFAGAPTIAQLESGQITLGEVPALGLEHFIQLNNRRKDADYAAHGGQPGPDTGPLWKWLQAAASELAARGYPSGDEDHMRRPDGTLVPIR
jgi:hypothetical protein